LVHKSDNSENRSNQAIPADSPRRCRGTREEGSWPSCRVYAERLGRGSAQGGTGEFRRGKLCADVEGFSLHAGVLIPDYCRDKLEQLCRYAARPPVVHARMSLTDGGKVLYKLKKKFRDGSTLVVLNCVIISMGIYSLHGVYHALGGVGSGPYFYRIGKISNDLDA
jgi:hypothetical protein